MGTPPTIYSNDQLVIVARSLEDIAKSVRKTDKEFANNCGTVSRMILRDPNYVLSLQRSIKRLAKTLEPKALDEIELFFGEYRHPKDHTPLGKEEKQALVKVARAIPEPAKVQEFYSELNQTYDGNLEGFFNSIPRASTTTNVTEKIRAFTEKLWQEQSAHHIRNRIFFTEYHDYIQNEVLKRVEERVNAEPRLRVRHLYSYRKQVLDEITDQFPPMKREEKGEVLRKYYKLGETLKQLHEGALFYFKGVDLLPIWARIRPHGIEALNAYLSLDASVDWDLYANFVAELRKEFRRLFNSDSMVELVIAQLDMSARQEGTEEHAETPRLVKRRRIDSDRINSQSVPHDPSGTLSQLERTSLHILADAAAMPDDNGNPENNALRQSSTSTTDHVNPSAPDDDGEPGSPGARPRSNPHQYDISIQEQQDMGFSPSGSFSGLTNFDLSGLFPNPTNFDPSGLFPSLTDFDLSVLFSNPEKDALNPGLSPVGEEVASSATNMPSPNTNESYPFG